jgi:hypothetical protein
LVLEWSAITLRYFQLTAISQVVGDTDGAKVAENDGCFYI